MTDSSFSLWHPNLCKLLLSVQSKPKGLRPRGVDGVLLSLSAREDEMRCPSQICEAGKKGQILPSSPFCSMQAMDGQVDAHPLGMGQLY